MKKKYKKILVNGDEIQAKYDGFEDNDIWQKEFEKVMVKYNLNYTKKYNIEFEDGYMWIYDIEQMLDYIACKNLPNVYLDYKNHIVLENEVDTPFHRIITIYGEYKGED